ncbi:hypothetical protein [Bradyrhizobium sp. SZCCHNR3118]|uniref:hypothetical protein n=1 Tax=Bradyrhizobium sp. SZCCHNR3118 TaxID=3057468 RepID=UPI0029170A22|nr:hypothetical protein [Bradyrhizobium sp. SZCCHNR3118]
MSIWCSLFGHRLDKNAAQPIHDHEGGFSHLDASCRRCGQRFEQWTDRDSGVLMTVPKDANPWDVAQALKEAKR